MPSFPNIRKLNSNLQSPLTSIHMVLASPPPTYPTKPSSFDSFELFGSKNMEFWVLKNFSVGKGKAQGHFVCANTWETREVARILCA